MKKRASQGFLDSIQNRALSRSVQLEAVYLEALLAYFLKLGPIFVASYPSERKSNYKNN